PDPGARVHARRHGHFQTPLGNHPPIAMTAGTRIGDHEAAAAAPSAGLLHAEEALTLDDHAPSLAPPAWGRLRSPTGAAAAALAAQFLARDGNRLGDAACRLHQLHFDGNLE